MDYVELPISKGLKTKIDADVYEKLKSEGLLKWNAQKNRSKFYVSRNYARHKKIYLHRWIMGNPDNVMIDHINRDPLDNRRCNLRFASARINAKNRDFDLNRKNNFSGTTKSGNKFISQIQINGIHFALGNFTIEEEAAKVRDIVDVIINGKNATPNFETSWNYLKLRDLIL